MTKGKQKQYVLTMMLEGGSSYSQSVDLDIARKEIVEWTGWRKGENPNYPVVRFGRGWAILSEKIIAMYFVEKDTTPSLAEKAMRAQIELLEKAKENMEEGESWRDGGDDDDDDDGGEDWEEEDE